MEVTRCKRATAGLFGIENSSTYGVTEHPVFAKNSTTITFLGCIVIDPENRTVNFEFGGETNAILVGIGYSVGVQFYPIP